MEDTTWVSHNKQKIIEYSQGSISFLPQLNSSRPIVAKIFHLGLSHSVLLNFETEGAPLNRAKLVII